MPWSFFLLLHKVEGGWNQSLARQIWCCCAVMELWRLKLSCKILFCSHLSLYIFIYIYIFAKKLGWCMAAAAAVPLLRKPVRNWRERSLRRGQSWLLEERRTSTLASRTVCVGLEKSSWDSTPRQRWEVHLKSSPNAPAPALSSPTGKKKHCSELHTDVMWEVRGENSVKQGEQRSCFGVCERGTSLLQWREARSFGQRGLKEAGAQSSGCSLVARLIKPESYSSNTLHQI